jgi:hypothetical protein
MIIHFLTTPDARTDAELSVGARLFFDDSGFARVSPSPRPSPAGRGRIVFRLLSRRMQAKTSGLLNVRNMRASCSLSQRERVRVRENDCNEWEVLLVFTRSLSGVGQASRLSPFELSQNQRQARRLSYDEE